MLRGTTIGLRARHDTDVPILHAELYDDVATQVRSDSRPWRPVGTAESPYRVREPDKGAEHFSVVQLADDQLAGEAVLWGIDVHHRSAHIGLSVRPAFRGRGLGTDIVATMCHYGFAIRGLHRLQIETLVDNHAMIAAATRNGFTLEGTVRGAAWVSGVFVDEVILGQLADEWSPS
jgi:RimJ/RimL family protein N-acetyltransferase